MTTPFFASPEMQQILQKARMVLGTTISGGDQQDKKRVHLEQLLDILQSAAASFDEHCQSNIEWIGSVVRSELAELASGSQSPDKLDMLIASLFRFVIELQLSTVGDLRMELNAFIRFVQENTSTFGPRPQEQIQHAERSMPIYIMKRLLGSDVLKNIRNVKEYGEKIEASFDGWEKQLVERERRAEALREAIKKHETAFNFVGLHKGFHELSMRKTKELWAQRIAMVALGVVALLPLGVEIGFIAWKFEELQKYQWGLLVSAVPVISLTVLLVYFFRLAVRGADSAKSQLIQIELRKTLCQFVQDYADYAKRIREGTPDVLAKFEGIIFSGIVGSDEKIPTTFDGVEQLSNLVKAVKG